MDKKSSRGTTDKGSRKSGSKKSTTKAPLNKEEGEKREIVVCEKPISIKCKNQEQINFLKVIDENEIIFCNGPSGCGKTALSVMKAINFLREDNNYKRIVLVTPIVEASRKSLGYLSGDFTAKVSVYVNSILRLFNKSIGDKQCSFLMEHGLIEIMNVGFMRGDNLENCIVIIDEAQNFDKKEMLTLLTRISENCKLLINGDLMQVDFTTRKEESGLYHAMNKLVDIDGIGNFTFTNDSIVRHGLIRYILDKY